MAHPLATRHTWSSSWKGSSALVWVLVDNLEGDCKQQHGEWKEGLLLCGEQGRGGGRQEGRGSVQDRACSRQRQRVVFFRTACRWNFLSSSSALKPNCCGHEWRQRAVCWQLPHSTVCLLRHKQQDKHFTDGFLFNPHDIPKRGRPTILIPDSDTEEIIPSSHRSDWLV